MATTQVRTIAGDMNVLEIWCEQVLHAIIRARTIPTVHACTIAIAYARALAVAHACTTAIVHACNAPIVHESTVTIVHACAISLVCWYVHVPQLSHVDVL